MTATCLPLASGALRHLVAKALAVGRDEEIKCSDHAAEMCARRFDLARFVNAGGDEKRVVLRAQFLQRGIAAHFEIELENNAAVFEALHAPRDDILLQLEIRNAIDQQAARAIMPVINRHAIAFAAQFFRRRKPRGPRADNAHMLRARAQRLQWFHPAALPRRIAQIFFHSTNGDGAVARLLDDAIAFAEPVLRADAPANLRHVVGGLRKLISLFDAAFGGQLQPVGNVVLKRAMHLAKRHAALRAARGLGRGFLAQIIGIDLVEIAHARVRGPLFRRLRRKRNEAQHLFGHWIPVLSLRNKAIGQGMREKNDL